MKLKTIKEQLIELGFKTNDKINVLDWANNPYVINLENDKLHSKYGDLCMSRHLVGLEFEKYTPTKEEIVNELKKRSKKFEKGKDNYDIYCSYSQNKVYIVNHPTCETLNALYFDEETAEEICRDLNSNREKTKVLFDLE